MTEDGELTAKSGFTAEERRDFVRIRKEIQVTCTILSAPKEEMAGETRDLGAGGVLLSTRRPLTPGVMLLLHVSTPHSAGMSRAFASSGWTRGNA